MERLFFPKQRACSQATTAVLHNSALMQREQDFDKDIENEDTPFDVVAAADASGNAKRQLITSR